MRTLLLAAAVILTMQTLVLATASSMVMAAAGTVFAERASTMLQKLAVATQIQQRSERRNATAQADSNQASQLAVALVLRPYGVPDARLAQTPPGPGEMSTA